MSDLQKPLPDEVNIEEIMQKIRQQILAKKASTSADGEPVVQIGGRRFSPEFYDHLYQAGLSYDKIFVQVHVSKNSIPILGPIVEKIRQKIHELVVYYVNQVAANQIRVNHHLLRALSILNEELDKDD